MTWVRAAKVTEISDGEAIVVERKPEPPVALFNVAGSFLRDRRHVHAREVLARRRVYRRRYRRMPAAYGQVQHPHRGSAKPASDEELANVPGQDRT